MFWNSKFTPVCGTLTSLTDGLNKWLTKLVTDCARLADFRRAECTCWCFQTVFWQNTSGASSENRFGGLKIFRNRDFFKSLRRKDDSQKASDNRVTLLKSPIKLGGYLLKRDWSPNCSRSWWGAFTGPRLEVEVGNPPGWFSWILFWISNSKGSLASYEWKLRMASYDSQITNRNRCSKSVN